MTVFNYIVGAVLTLAPLTAGIMIKFFPPKKINRFYGLKTKTTAQNQQTWDYAHKVCANTLLIYSIFGVVVYIIALILHIVIIKQKSYIMFLLGLILALLGALTAFLIAQIKTKKFSRQQKGQ